MPPHRQPQSVFEFEMWAELIYVCTERRTLYQLANYKLMIHVCMYNQSVILFYLFFYSEAQVQAAISEVNHGCMHITRVLDAVHKLISS